MNENEIKKCQNPVERNGEWVECEKTAIASHWDCCGGYWGMDICADCLPTMIGGDTMYCEWYNTVDGVVVSSSDPAEIGKVY